MREGSQRSPHSRHLRESPVDPIRIKSQRHQIIIGGVETTALRSKTILGFSSFPPCREFRPPGSSSGPPVHHPHAARLRSPLPAPGPAAFPDPCRQTLPARFSLPALASGRSSSRSPCRRRPTPPPQRNSLAAASLPEPAASAKAFVVGRSLPCSCQPHFALWLILRLPAALRKFSRRIAATSISPSGRFRTALEFPACCLRLAMHLHPLPHQFPA